MTRDTTTITAPSDEENSQLLRTVEMFEAITESQPDDYQSLEILKETYTKLGRTTDGLRTSKKLAAVYRKLGQISQAILEYEGILQEDPTTPDVIKALAELETKAAKIGPTSNTTAPSPTDSSKPVVPPSVSAGAPKLPAGKPTTEDGDRALANILIGEKLVTPQAIEPLLQRLKAARAAGAEKGQGLSLVQLLSSEQIGKLDDLLTVIVEKSNLPYLPLSGYDVDRDVACLLPQELCWQHCLIPFDLISRSLLIATANPFHQRACDQAQAMLDYNIFWYIAPPGDIVAALRRAHGMESPRPPVKPS